MQPQLPRLRLERLMARIEDSQVKETSGAYTRLFGVPALGHLMSRVQSTVISSGTELERMVLDPVEQLDNLDEFLRQDIMPEGVLISPKTKIKKSTSLDFPGAEPDFLIFKRRSGQQSC